MTPLECPICGEAVFQATGLYCPECGAALNQPSEAAALYSDAPTEPVTEPEPLSEFTQLETDELIAALRSNFEQNRILLPQAWIQRLTRLATQVESSRRQATIVFIDLRGYSSLTESLSEGQLDNLRQWFYSVCTRRIALHGGFVIQFLGDAVFAAFGAPYAFERDAESALKALLEIRAVIRERGTYEGHPLSIRAGADTGVVNVRLTTVQGQMRPDLFGSAVNLAARLQEAADTWEILISDTLAQQIRPLFKLDPRPAMQPKNIERMVSPCAVIERENPPGEQREQNLPLMGRAAEVRTLRDWLQWGCSRQFFVAAVTGPPGIGKTRLVREVMTTPDAEVWTMLAGHCEPHDRHVPLGITMRIIAQMARVLGEEQADLHEDREWIFQVLRDKLELPQAAQASLGYLLRLEPHLGFLSQMPGNLLHKQVISCLVDMLARLGRKGRYLVWMDDFHWCDPLSAQVLDQLSAVRPEGIVMLLTGRSQVQAAAKPNDAPRLLIDARPAGLAIDRHLELGLLTHAASEALAGAILDLQTLHPLVRQRLFAEAQRFPLYLIEISRQLKTLPRHLHKPTQLMPDAETMPALLYELLQARIDSLETRHRQLLQHAAVIGRRFSVDLIEIIGQLRENVLAELLTLSSLQMLEVEAGFSPEVFAFTPSYLRDVAYNMLTREQQAKLHASLAQALTQQFPERERELSYQIALHWIQAGNLNAARAYLRRAALHTLALGLPIDAAALIERALELHAEGPLDEESDIDLQQRGILLEIAGRAWRLGGNFDHSDQYFREFLAIAERIDNPRWRLLARLQSAINLLERGDAPAAEQALAGLLPEKGQFPDLEHKLTLTLGICRMRQGKLGAAQEAFAKVAHDAGESDPNSVLIGDALNNSGLIYWMQGDYSAAGERFARAHAHWLRLSNRFGAALTLSNLGIIAEQEGNFEQARQRYTEALELSNQIGYLHRISAAESNLSNLDLLGSNWHGAQNHAARALEFAIMLGHGHVESIARENLALAYGGQGLYDQAFEMLDKAQGKPAAREDPERRDSLRLARTWLLIGAGRTRSALEALQEVSGEVSPGLAAWRMQLNWLAQLREQVEQGQPPPAQPIPNYDGAGIPDHIRHLCIFAFACRLAKWPEELERALQSELNQLLPQGA